MATWGDGVWGTFIWGAEPSGGWPTPTGDYQWTLAVDWGNGWINEAGRCVAMPRSPRGRQHYVAQNADTFEHCQPARFSFELENYDRRYDPYNTSSPLYGLIKPGRPVWMRVKYDHVSYPVFRGLIANLIPITGTNRVQMICDDYLQWLAGQDISLTLTSNNQSLTVSDVIKAVLIEAKYPYPVQIDDSNCPITYFSVNEQNALDVIRQLCDAGIGTAYCDADGVFHYKDLSSSGLTNHTLTQAELLKQIAPAMPWENVRNKITTVANRYGYSAAQELWRSDEPIYVEAGSTTSIKIEFDGDCIPIQPVEGVDYFADARPIVSGGVISWGIYFTCSLSAITSSTATLNIHNADPASAQWLAWIAIRGNKLVNKKIPFSATDAVSAADGPKRLRIDSPWLQDRGFAAAYAPLLLAHLKDPSKNPIIQLETRGDGLGIDLFHTVTLDIEALGIDETFDVGGIDWEWIPDARGITNGQSFRQTIYLQKVLYSSDSITPQPFVPGLPAVPVNPGPGGPGGTTANPGEGGPTYQQTMTCLDDVAPQGSNGPYTTGQNTVISNEQGGASYNAGLWFRTMYNANRTYVAIDGVWESLVAGVWTPDASWDFDTINAYDITNHQVFVGGLAAQGAVADGLRYYLWQNTLKYFVKNIAFQFAALGTENLYAKSGPAINTVTVQSNNASGVAVATNLVVGAWYCIETSGGPWNAGADNPAQHTTGEALSGGGGSYGWGGYHATGYSGPTPTGYAWGSSGANVLQAGNYARIFFQATHATALFRAVDSPSFYGDNTGTITGTLYNAIHGASKRCRVRSVNFYNVCQGAPGGPM